MLTASGVAGEIELDAVPVIDGVRALVADGMVAGGTQRNHADVSDTVAWNGIAIDEQHLLADAQTSGGLLLAVDAARVDALVDALAAHGTLARAVVGRVVDVSAGTATIR
jgi:selenide,water dikinase